LAAHAQSAHERDYLFCLACTEQLSYKLQSKLLDEHRALSRDYSPDTYWLAIFSSDDRAHLVSSLAAHEVNIPQHLPLPELQNYLAQQFQPTETSGFYGDTKSYVTLISSTGPGMGKSWFIKNQARKLACTLMGILAPSQVTEEECALVMITIPIQEETSVKEIMDALPKEEGIPKIVHFDCATTTKCDLDMVLFQLFIQHTLKSGSGAVWHRLPSIVFFVETPADFATTLPQMRKLGRMLPLSLCPSPAEILGNPTYRDGQPFDEVHKFSKATHYLQQVPPNFTQFVAPPNSFDHIAALRLLAKSCGVPNPSWAVLTSFVNFLDHSFLGFENSPFVGDVMAQDLPGFRDFVIRFALIASRDFSSPSLDVQRKTAALEDGNEGEDDLLPFQLRLSWEQSTHPYLFFNFENSGFTFFSFRVNKEGARLDPHGLVAESNFISRQLFAALAQQNVDFNPNYSNWPQQQFRDLLSVAIGAFFPEDTHDYLLTEDNMKKILAISTRFKFVTRSFLLLLLLSKSSDLFLFCF